jgi:hypothetical protein
MSKFYTYQSWFDTFKPIKNNLTNGADYHFETYGDEYEFVKAQDPNTIWTEVDGDSGTYIISGWHYVNRIHYYITEEKWDDEYTEVPSWVYRRCDCTEEDGFEDGNPDCTECEFGDIDIPIDTVEDLKQIYGEDNADIIA